MAIVKSQRALFIPQVQTGNLESILEFSAHIEKEIVLLLGVAKHKRNNRPTYLVAGLGTTPYIRSDMPYLTLTTVDKETIW
ncbi:MAG: hypothetical protein ACETWB_00510 [Anaerolineae bacterium]